MNLIHTGIVKEGKINLDNPQRFISQVRALDGKKIDLTIRKHRERRSDNQNKYYHGVIVKMLSEHLGYDTDSMHESLKEKFLSEPADENGLKRIGSTAKLTTDEFIQYTNRIVRWSAEFLNLYIPDPGQAEW